jgi:O-antigen ligase
MVVKTDGEQRRPGAVMNSGRGVSISRENFDDRGRPGFSIRNWHNSLIFTGLFALSLLLVLNLKIGFIVAAGSVLLVTALLKPKLVYFLMLSLLSMEGFAAFTNFSYPKIAGVLLITGLALRFALTKEAIPGDSSYKYFFFFFLGGLVSFVVAKDLNTSMSMYIVYVALFFLYLFTRYFLRSIDDIQTGLNYIFASTFLVYVFIHFMGLSVRGDGSTRISSGMGDPNAYAAYISVLIPLVIYRIMNVKGKAVLLYWACLAGFLLIMVLTGSRGGILGFLGMALVLIYYYTMGKFRQMIIFLTCAAIIAYLFAPEEYWTRLSTIVNPELEKNASISYRTESYRAALKMFFDHPLTGVGLYNFKFMSTDYNMVGGKVVHNMYLEMLSGGGLLIFIPFILILINTWRKLSTKIDMDKNMRDLLICLKAAFVSFLITSCFLSSDHEKILWFLLALCSSAYYIALSRRISSGSKVPA